MKRLFIASKGNLAPLADMFRRALPDFDIEHTLPLSHDEPVPFLVVGRPPSGVIAAIPGVQIVLSLNAGIEHILAGGEVPPDVPIVRLVDDALAEGMSEWVLGQALAWHRNFALYAGQQARLDWTQQSEKLAKDRLVTVLGAGELGRAVAGHFVRFGFKTRVWSRSGREIAGATTFAGRGQLLAAADGADILVNLLPLTPETADIVDAALLARLNPGAFFINGARGGHVVDADLIAALDSGQLSSAALDVFRTEPLPVDDPLWRHPKVLLFPHVSAPTHPESAVVQIADTIGRYERGEPIANIVDRTRGY